MSRCVTSLIAVGLLVLLSACNADRIGSSSLVSQTAARAQLVSNMRAQAGAPTPGYLLHASDKVRVKVYNEAEITGEYEVDAAGFVSIPLAGRIRAAGTTPRQLERAIRARLRDGIITDPKVSVEIAAYAPFYIHGEVKRAGELPYRPGITVIDAIASAGGFTYRADEGKVFLRRAGSMVEDVYPTDLPVPVYPGDNVRIPERYF